jgi:NDP-sugar pyrophosphorylase family protein
VFAISHLAEIISAVVGDGKRWGLEVEYSVEDIPLGTIGPLRLIDNLPENFLVVNGDILTDLDLNAFFEYHVTNDALLTVATFKRTHQVDFGVLHFSEDDCVVNGFEEKPSLHYSVSMGVYGMKREVLNHIPENQPMGLDTLVDALLAAGKTVKVYRHEGQWLDIGRLEDYLAANSDEMKPCLDDMLKEG